MAAPAARALPEGPSAPKSFRDKLGFPFGRGTWWVDSTTKVAYTKEKNPELWRKAVILEINDHGFDCQVFTVAALGFLTDSYALFATNVVLPSLAYIYWPDVTDGSPELTINCVTLAGSVIGQLLFGWAADKWGRRKLYGLELVLVIFGSLGMAQASSGIGNNMDVLRWIVFYRFWIGVGIGAEYPLSAVITAEFADTDYRAQMMAGVFLMQPLGQIFAASVGWGVLNIVKGRGLSNLPAHGADLTEDQKLAILSAIDTIWRWVVGAGCIPAAASILWRFAIPESPRYTMDNDDNATQAYYNLRRYKKKKDNEVTAERVRRGQPPDRTAEANQGEASRSSHTAPSAENANGGATRRRPGSNSLGTTATEGQSSQSSRTAEQNIGIPSTNTSEHMSTTGIHSANTAHNVTPNHLTYPAPIHNGTQVTSSVASESTKITFYQHFFEDGNWRYLFATTICWFSLNFAFYALGINNPRQISAIWDNYLPLPERNNTQYDWPSTLLIGINNPTFSNKTVPDWQNPFDPSTNIYHELFDSAKQYIITISCGSLVGSLLLLYYINNIPRKMWLVYSFLILALLFVVLGAFYKRAAFTESHWAIVVFYILCQLFFNLGPNTLTFIIPAEIFPTRFRSTCHGISAAFGKIGAIFIQAILSTHRFKSDPKYLRVILGIFSIPMCVGAMLAWIWIPNLQKDPIPSTKPMHWAILPSKDLETLARGWEYANSTEAEIDLRTQVSVLGEDQKLGFQKFPNLYHKLVTKYFHGGFER